MLDSVADFALGETIQGQNDDGVDINTALDGREYTFPVTEDVAAAANMTKRVVGQRVTARIVRNKTGNTLAAGEIFVIDIDGGLAGVGKADAKAGNRPIPFRHKDRWYRMSLIKISNKIFPSFPTVSTLGEFGSSIT